MGRWERRIVIDVFMEGEKAIVFCIIDLVGVQIPGLVACP